MPGRILFALIFAVAGALHFLIPRVYTGIMPAYLPAPMLLVQISGICEILGGLGVLFPSFQRPAAWGMVALLIAVLPANLNMALHPQHWPIIPPWLLWARLPLQIPLIAWAWSYTRMR